MKTQNFTLINNLILLLALLFSIDAFAMIVPEGFARETVKLDGVTLNVYRGGHGEPLVLIHGYATTALMWAPAMKALKGKYTVIVPDLRGAGLSEVTASGYDEVTMAQDMKNLLDHYHIAQARVVGHDIGLMVAYALAAKYPDRVKKLVLMDAFLPGVGPGEAIYNSPDMWQFRFYGPFAEELVKGRERIALDTLWEGFSAKPHTFPEDEKLYFVSQFAKPGRMGAGFSFFKAMPQDAIENRELAKTKLQMPVLAIGGEKSLGPATVQTTKLVAVSVQEKVVPDCGHWMMEECPDETIKALEQVL
jgi:pimeloyl-ACP methyl ester carboxylesterase